MFSICLCVWNDLPYLKLLHSSLKKYTKIPYELIIHDNGSEDGTEDWLKEMSLKYSRSSQNEGVSAVNYAVAQSRFKYVIDINADMFVLPNWDIEIFKQIKTFERNKIKKYTISSCLIEPIDANPEYTIRNHGTVAQNFNEASLLSDFARNSKNYEKQNTNQYSHPIGMPKYLWDEIGGIDTKYFPGQASDHDLAAKCYESGCRNYVMLGKSRVYHFVSQTLGKLPDNLRRKHGQDIFENKWGMTVEAFRRKINVGDLYVE